MNFRVLAEVVVILLLVVAGLLLALALTGYQARSYKVLPPETTVQLKGETLTVGELAERYQPQMYLRSKTPSPPLLYTGYSVVPNGHFLDVIYYHVWEDEVNPNKAFNSLYALFRAVYYGYPLRDIEFFQIKVDPSSGEVKELFFETGLTTDYFNTLNEHILARVVQQDDGRYVLTLTRKNSGEEISSSDVTPTFEDGHVAVGALTWNHLTVLVDPRIQPEYDQRLTSDLRFLSDEDFKKGRFVRKSQPDHATREHPTFLILSFIVIFFIVILPFTAVRLVTWIRRIFRVGKGSSHG